MLFRFRMEKFQDLVRNLVVSGKRVEVGAGGRLFLSLLRMLLNGLVCNALLSVVQGRRLDGKREAVALFESSDVFHRFLAGVADLQQIGFEDGNSVGEEFRE